MKLKPNEVAKWEESLRKAEYMSDEDHIIENVQGDLWEMMSQTRGNFFFTKEKFIFVGGLGLNSFAINYSDIKGIKKSMINFFIPTGMTVTAFDPEAGKEKKYKCSVMKRTNWIEYLSKRANITS